LKLTGDLRICECCAFAPILTRPQLNWALGSNSFILMDAIELRRRGVELLSPVPVPYGFVYQAGEVESNFRHSAR
jgi:hypothetical protein